MRLSGMVYADGIVKRQQTAFGGYNHTLAAGDGELYDMENLSSVYYPLLSPRPGRKLVQALEKPNGLFCRDALCWVDGTGFYYNGVRKGTVSDGAKTFATMGVYILVLPDKAFYNTKTDEFGALEACFTSAAGGVTFQNGTLYGESAEANTLTCAAVNWNSHFKAGDAVTISGCTVHTENNKTPIIREISEDGHSLRFYENVFKLSGEAGTEAYAEPGAVTLARTMPEMDHLCANENRLWGCKGDTIYASKLGDPFNWNVFDGLPTDAFSVETGSAGAFTGCCSYLGYPIFFKPGSIYKVYGSVPSNFEVMGSATLGVAAGAGESLAVAGETLFYLGRSGVTAYTGGIPAPISTGFGDVRYKNAVGGSDGLKYYVSMQAADGGWHLFAYDTQKGVWHREDGTQALGFAYTDNLYMLAADGKLWMLDSTAAAPAGAADEEPVAWFAEFGDFTEGEANKKGVTKLQIRLEVDAGAEVAVFIQYDSSGEWERVTEIAECTKRSFYLPVVPRRADHYRIKLVGTGGCRVYSVAREVYAGSALKSTPGRN